MEDAPTQEIPPYILVAMLFAILIIYYYGHIIYHNIWKGIFRGKQENLALFIFNIPSNYNSLL
jgi:hypothetical protein